MKKVWEALESVTKELSKPSKSKKDEDTRPVTKVATSNPAQPLATNLLSTVATSNRFEHLTADSTGIEFNQQKRTKATKVSTKDADQVKIKAFEKKISELEHQIQTRKSIIKNLSLANERLLQENSDLRKKINSDQVTSKKAKNCIGGIQSNTAKNDSRSNQGNGKPSIFIAGDSMVHDLKGWLMSRDKAVKVHSFPGASCDDIENFLIPLINRTPDQILLHVGTNDLRSGAPEEVAHRISNLTGVITSRNIKCAVSSIIRRGDYLATKGEEVNRLLFNILPEHVKLISNSNINENHLNRSQLHLNRRGTGAFAHDIIQFIKHSDLAKKICLMYL